MNSYVEHFEISSHDVDANNIVKPSIITRMFQETANHQMRDRKPSYLELFSQGMSYVLIRMVCEIKEELHPYDMVSVATWISESKGATFRRSYLMTRDGSECARAYSEWAVVNRNDDSIMKVTDIDFSHYEKDERIGLTIPVKFHFPKELEFEKVGEKKICYTDCDMNLHMNNTFYQDVMFSHIEEPWNKKVSSFSIRFMREAAMGKTLELCRAKADETMDDGLGAEESWFFKNTVDGAINTEAIINCINLKKY